MARMTEVTRILNLIEEGDTSAPDRLLPLVYDELRKLAASRMANEKPGQTLQATALVHEAYLRLVGNGQNEHWDSRGHFFAAAAEAMRRVVVETARRRVSLKRGGNFERQDVDDVNLAISDNLEEILSINQALEKLETENEKAAKLVKLRYFAGFTIEEAAQMLGISPSRANQIWAYAKSWLLAELDEEIL